jgi:MFS family permease
MSAPAATIAEPARAATLGPSALWGLLLSAALVPLGSTMVAVALAAIGHDLQADAAALTQWLVNSYLLVGIVLLGPAGKLVDRWGVDRALLLGQALFAVGAGLGFLGGSLALLVAARVTMAAGGALLVPATMAALRHATEPERRARVFGAFGAGMGLAAALGPLVGGVLVDSFGWRSIFLANLPVLAVAAPLVRGVAVTRPGPGGGPFDWVGSALLATGLTLAIAGSRIGGAGAMALCALGGAVLLAFVRWERRTDDPVLDPALFGHPSFAAGAGVVALHNWVMYALVFQLPLWFGSLTGSGSAEIGRALIAMMLSMVVCAPVGGRASERLGARAVAVPGTLAALAGLLLLTRLGPLDAPPDAVPALILIGAGLGLASAPTQSSALGAIPRRQSGMAAGALSTMRYLGGVIGIGLLGATLRDLAGASSAALLAAHQQAVWLYCAVMLASTLLAALLPGRPAIHARPGPTGSPGAGERFRVSERFLFARLSR